MHLRFAVKGVARPALETRCLFSSGSQSMFCEWKGMRGSRLSESAEEECTVHLRSRPPSFSLGCVCMCCSGLRGLEDQQSFLTRTLPGHQALVLLRTSPEVFVLFPPLTPVTSLMVCTCCPSSLSLATPDPTRTWQTSPGTRTLYPSKLTMRGGPRARHPRLTTPTQLPGQRLWLPTLSW